MGRGGSFFVDVNLMVFSHRHAEFLLDGLFGPGEETFPQFVVVTRSQDK